jgi:hypothetical protein
MFYGPDFLVGEAASKALVTAETASTTYGQLKGQQSDMFFRKVIDQQVMTKYAQRVYVDGPTLDLNDIDLTSYMAMGLAEGTTIAGTDDESSVTFGGRTLTPVKSRMVVRISRETLQRTNIEREGINDTIMQLMSTAHGNHIEKICIKSEDGGSDETEGTGNLTQLDGWRALADSANVYDHAGGYYNSLLIRRLWENIPSKWKSAYPNYEEWRVFMPFDAELALRDLYAQRSTAFGDGLLAGSDGLSRILRTPLVGVPHIPTDLAGLQSQSESSSEFGWCMLARPANMVFGFRPEIEVYAGRNVEGNISYLSFYAEWAPQFRNIDEVAVAINVQNDVSY